MAAAIGVFIAAVYYVMTLRTAQRNMRITLTNSLMQSLLSEEWRRWFELLYMEWKDYDDFERKYGTDIGFDNASKRMNLWYTYNVLGRILESGLADKETLYNVMSVGAVWLWVKFKPIIEEHRRRYSGKDAYSGFEYLANEMLKMKRQRDPSFQIPETFAKYIPDE